MSVPQNWIIYAELGQYFYDGSMHSLNLTIASRNTSGNSYMLYIFFFTELLKLITGECSTFV